MEGQCLPKRNHSASKGTMLLSVQSDADWKTLHEHPSLVNVSVSKLPLQIPPEHAKTQKKILNISNRLILLYNPFDSNLTSVTLNFFEVDNGFGSVWWKKKRQVILHLTYYLLIAVSRAFTQTLPPTSKKEFHPWADVRPIFLKTLVSIICEKGPIPRRTLTSIPYEVFAQPVGVCWFTKRRMTN